MEFTRSLKVLEFSAISVLTLHSWSEERANIPLFEGRITMSEIKFHLSVCETKPFVELEGQKFLAGHRGEGTIKHSIRDDILYLDFDWCGHKPWVGDASHIVAVSIRGLSDRRNSIAIYETL
jgi:hypothetical protein